MKNNMKILWITLGVLVVLVFSQPINAQKSNFKNKTGTVNKDSIYWQNLDKYPEFPGGRFGMSTFMYKNLKYPQKAITNKQKGLLRVDYVVRKDGSITNLEILTKETSQELNNEVLRVMKLMPKFKPAVHKGKKVSYRDRAFVEFQLKPCSKKEFYPIIITPTDCGLPSFSPDAKGVFTFTEKMPEYPDGEAELLSFVFKNLRGNKPGEEGIQGTVIVKFVVSKTGKVKDIVVVRKLDPDYDKEAVRVVKLLPDWIPGEHNGQKVDVYYTLPVLFRLE